MDIINENTERENIEERSDEDISDEERSDEERSEEEKSENRWYSGKSCKEENTDTMFPTKSNFSTILDKILFIDMNALTNYNIRIYCYYDYKKQLKFEFDCSIGEYSLSEQEIYRTSNDTELSVIREDINKLTTRIMELLKNKVDICTEIKINSCSGNYFIINICRETESDFKSKSVFENEKNDYVNLAYFAAALVVFLNISILPSLIFTNLYF